MGDKHLVLVHGRHFKPSKAVLEKNWTEAIRLGLQRDYNEGVVTAYNNVKISMAYYGNVSNKFLRARGREYDSQKDNTDRKKTLTQLKQHHTDDFTKDNYEALPGATPLLEGLADALSKPLELIGLADNLIGKVAPDMEDYWDPDESFGSDARWPLTMILKEALINNEDVLLVTHSLGTLIAYDVLWKFCYYREYRDDLSGKKVNNWITLGCPLGNSTVKRKIKGASARGERRYPYNIKNWINIAAEDDYISHDQTVANDYSKMIKWGMVNSIKDHRIYNLSVRHGKSNPHHGAGYLIHPAITREVADWLC